MRGADPPALLRTDVPMLLLRSLRSLRRLLCGCDAGGPEVAAALAVDCLAVDCLAVDFLAAEGLGVDARAREEEEEDALLPTLARHIKALLPSLARRIF